MTFGIELNVIGSEGGLLFRGREGGGPAGDGARQGGTDARELRQAASASPLGRGAPGKTVIHFELFLKLAGKLGN